MIRACKTEAIKRIKKNYMLLVVVCVLAGFLGVKYSSSIDSLKDLISGVDQSADGRSHHVNSMVDTIVEEEQEEARQVADAMLAEAEQKESSNLGPIAIEHTRGVLASLTNTVDSGAFVFMIYDGIFSITKTKGLAIALMIVGSLLFAVFVGIFISGIVHVTIIRIFLEARLYDSIPKSKFTYLVRIKKCVNVSLALLRVTLYKILWSFTIVGVFIKAFSYMMVPYILAENPQVSGKDAILLSRRMMDGHKKEAFYLQLSFLGWNILDIFTFGLTGIFFANPYKELTFAAYYAKIREMAIDAQIEGVEVLNDTYLFEYAPDDVLQETYSNGVELAKAAKEELPKNKGFRGFLENTFGLTFLYDQKEQAYEQANIRKAAGKGYVQIMEHSMYPMRLFGVRENKDRDTKRPSNHFYDRHYSIVSVVLSFFVLSFIGWAYEVSLHLISDGEFVNRGTLHGPWLPIYGYGGVLILLILYRFRKRPGLHYVLSMILCGIVEYCTAWELEMTHGGMKWWDYSGYFLNIDGRICAEGLIVFGLGGLAIVYFVAPILDNLFRKISLKILIPIAAALLIIFIGDNIYSHVHPNTGKGITSVCTEINIRQQL